MRSGGRFHLPLQLLQVAAQTIRDLNAQFGELEELLPDLLLSPKKKNGGEGCSGDEQREHYEYELH
jgi:hypothetical protein